MKCSRVVLSLLLAALGGAVIALGLAGGQKGVAADIGPEQPPYVDTLERAGEIEGHDAYATDDEDYYYGDYEYAYPEKTYGYEADVEDEQDIADEEDAYEYDDYNYGGYEYGAADEGSETDLETSETENAADEEEDFSWECDEYDSEFGEDNYQYGDDYEYTDEYGEEPETDDADTYEDDYSYEYDEYDYNYGDDYEGTDEYGEEPTTDVADTYEDDYSYEYDEYDSAYDDDYEDTDEYGVEPETDDADTYEDDYSYEYDEYDSAYGDDYEDTDEYGKEPETDDADAYEDDYSYEYDEYDYEYGDEYEYADEYGEEPEADVADTYEDDYSYEYGEYEYEHEYSYPEEQYGYTDAVDEGPDDSWEEPYCEWTPEEQTVGSETSFDGEIDLSFWLPGELLTSADADLLRTLATLSEEPAERRRSTLQDYLEVLDAEAFDFANRFEQATGIDYLDLANDTPGAAALLVTIRLIERGDVTFEQGIDMLRRGLQNISEEWLDDVTEITAEQPDWSANSPAEPTVFRVVASWTSESLDELGSAVRGISRQISNLNWALLVIDWRDPMVRPAQIGWSPY